MCLYYDDRLGELRVGLYSSESNGDHVLFVVVFYSQENSVHLSSVPYRSLSSYGINHTDVNKTMKPAVELVNRSALPISSQLHSVTVQPTPMETTTLTPLPVTVPSIPSTNSSVFFIQATVNISRPLKPSPVLPSPPPLVSPSRQPIFQNQSLPLTQHQLTPQNQASPQRQPAPQHQFASQLSPQRQSTSQHILTPQTRSQRQFNPQRQSTSQSSSQRQPTQHKLTPQTHSQRQPTYHRRHYSRKSFSSSSVTLPGRRIEHYPHATYLGFDYPHDHIKDSVLRVRLHTLVSQEQATIADLAQSHIYRREYYQHCFDSLVPLYKRTKAQRYMYANNVFLGVRRDSQGSCPGCRLKKPFHYNTNMKQIRKFVGNREVFNIVTNINGILAPFLSL